MNKDLFLRCVENTRDCENDHLDIAVNKGLHRGKNDSFDFKKLFMLVSASVFSFVVCVAVNLMPLTTIVDEYYRNRQKIMPGSSEMLDIYIKDIAGNLEKYLGGK
jgi:hypothetical protein